MSGSRDALWGIDCVEKEIMLFQELLGWEKREDSRESRSVWF